MAILKNGPNGGFTGKVGNVVGYQWKGKDVIRALPRFPAKKRTPAQLANQLKMTLTQRFLQRITPFIRMGFRHEAEQRRMSAFNVAMSYNKKQAITGVYPDLRFDYPNAIVSMGGLAPMKGGSVRWIDKGLKLTWTNDVGQERVSNLDRLLVLLCFPEYEACIFRFNGALREAGQDTLAIDAYLVGKPVHVYATFIRYDGSDVSPSSYFTVG